MDPSSFQKWLESVIPQMTCLSREQTKFLFTTFVERCSVEQKIYLETDIRYLLAQDFMALPSLIVNKILGYVDVKTLLTIRMVCTAWCEKISANSQLWMGLCWALGGKTDICSQVPADYFFHMYLRLQKIRSQMTDGKVFATDSITLHDHGEKMNSQELSCSRIAYGSGIIVMGTKERKILGLDPKTKQKKWEVTGNVISSLYISNSLIVAGTYLGQLKVFSLNGKLQYEQQCGCNAVTTLDVHSSGHFLLAGFCDGTVRLLDNELNQCIVDLEIPSFDNSSEYVRFQENVIKKVFFLPESSLPSGQLAACVCAKRSVSIAVIEQNSGVLKQLQRLDSLTEMTSFCHCTSDPHTFYAAVKSESHFAEIIQCQTHFDLEGGHILERKQMVLDGFLDPLFHVGTFNVLVLAAGKRFLVAAIDSDLVMFDLVKHEKISTVSGFLDRHKVNKLLIEQNQDALLAVNSGWLDGLSPSTAQAGKPLIFFGMTCPNLNNSVMQSLCWASDLWSTSEVCDIKDGGFSRCNGYADSCGSISDTCYRFAGNLDKGKGGDTVADIDQRDTGKTAGRGDEENRTQNFIKVESKGIWRNAIFFQNKVRDMESSSR